ncbi:hypothetical protein H1C71_035931 [Ictidomys tridecemlineatus]|nr:hypothetical protein H1C71_035931 [Ictidomys tridecemlineatus]
MQNVGTSAGHVSGASVGPQDLEDMELSHFQESSSLHHKHGRKDREEQEGEAQSPKRRSSISAVSTGPHLQPCLPGSSRPAFQPQSYFGHNVFECFGDWMMGPKNRTQDLTFGLFYRVSPMLFCIKGLPAQC